MKIGNYQAAQIAMSCRPTQTESKIFLMDLLDKLEAVCLLRFQRKICLSDVRI